MDIQEYLHKLQYGSATLPLDDLVHALFNIRESLKSNYISTQKVLASQKYEFNIKTGTEEMDLSDSDTDLETETEYRDDTWLMVGGQQKSDNLTGQDYISTSASSLIRGDFKAKTQIVRTFHFPQTTFQNPQIVQQVCQFFRNKTTKLRIHTLWGKLCSVSGEIRQLT